MIKISRRVMASVITIALLSPVIVQAGPASHPISEDAALSLLLRTLKHDRVYARRISLDCVTFVTEEKTDAHSQFVLREYHTAPCGGDPETSPVVDATAFIALLEKLNGWTRLKIIGSVTTQHILEGNVHKRVRRPSEARKRGDFSSLAKLVIL
jgi:hypothetical protein